MLDFVAMRLDSIGDLAGVILPARGHDEARLGDVRPLVGPIMMERTDVVPVNHDNTERFGRGLDVVMHTRHRSNWLRAARKARSNTVTNIYNSRIPPDRQDDSLPANDEFVAEQYGDPHGSGALDELYCPPLQYKTGFVDVLGRDGHNLADVLVDEPVGQFGDSPGRDAVRDRPVTFGGVWRALLEERSDPVEEYGEALHSRV